MEADSRRSAVRYISQWPPAEGAEVQPPSTKRPRGADSDALTGAETSKEREGPVELELGLGCTERVHLGLSESNLQPKELKLVQCDATHYADVLLARWWKLKQGTLDLRKGYQIPQQCNPKTSLYHIARLPQCKMFLQHRICHLESGLSILNSGGGLVSDCAELHVSLATCLQKLGNYQQALEHAEKGLSLSSAEQRNYAAWMCELLRRQVAVQEKQKKASEQLRDVPLPLSMRSPVQVECRREEDLSFKEFFLEYALTHTPVVITGLVEKMTTHPWTLDRLTKVIGHKTAPLKRMVAGSVEWARLETAGECTVNEFINSLDDKSAENLDLHSKYLFDWSLPLHCPELVEELTIPRYFAGDFLQRAPAGSLYRESWPSLFVAPSGVTSELHVDAFGSNFWMALFQGRKRWFFFPPEDVPLLYPVYSHSTDAVFEANLSSPNLHNHPLLALTHPRECILEPGDVLFVPAGCPHRVENLEASFAISANFVDMSNLEAVCSELRVNALVDGRSTDLLKFLQMENFCCDLDEAQENLVWRDFKTWPRNIVKKLETC